MEIMTGLRKVVKATAVHPDRELTPEERAFLGLDEEGTK